MAYEVYLDDILLPIPPSKIQMKVKGQNKTINLVNGEEVNIVKPPGLTEFSFDAVFPNNRYPFANYERRFRDAESYLDDIEDLKASKTPFPFIIIRNGPDGRGFHDTNIDVVLEDYKVTDDVKEGFDISVSFNLKECPTYGTRTLNISILPEKQEPQVTEETTREADTAPAANTYTVQSGDCLWNIAKKVLGNGSRYPEIYNLNRDKIGNPNIIHEGQVLTMP